MKLRLFGPGGRVWRLAFRIKHTAKSLKYRQLYNIKGGGGGGRKKKKKKYFKYIKKLSVYGKQANGKPDRMIF